MLCGWLKKKEGTGRPRDLAGWFWVVEVLVAVGIGNVRSGHGTAETLREDVSAAMNSPSGALYASVKRGEIYADLRRKDETDSSFITANCNLKLTGMLCRLRLFISALRFGSRWWRDGTGRGTTNWRLSSMYLQVLPANLSLLTAPRKVPDCSCKSEAHK